MKLIWLITMVATGLMRLVASAEPAPSPWEQPAETLAAQVAEMLGPGQAHLTIRNLSSVSNDEIPTIRRLLERDLKAHGVLASGTESANSIRLTLSENQRERIWVAEIVEGTETRVTMVRVEKSAAQPTLIASGLLLRKQTIFTSKDAVLTTLETADGMVVIEPEEIVILTQASDGWHEQKRVSIGQKRSLARDPRATILPAASGKGFDASLAGIRCSGNFQPAQPTGEWNVRCRESDDPWSLVQSLNPTDGPVTLKAFYNAARNYFTGVVTPNLGVDLPPFYSATPLPRPASEAALVVGGIDGRTQIVESNALKSISGTRDWSSDFVALHSGCGAGTQIIASGSGEAINDSLRAYELPALEAIPASTPLAMDGTVTALWAAPDGKSIFTTVRNAADQYEVDRVTASCN